MSRLRVSGDLPSDHRQNGGNSVNRGMIIIRTVFALCLVFYAHTAALDANADVQKCFQDKGGCFILVCES